MLAHDGVGHLLGVTVRVARPVILSELITIALGLYGIPGEHLGGVWWRWVKFSTTEAVTSCL